VLQFTHSPWVAGIAGSANLLPLLLAALLGGRAIDRWGAWPLAVVADLASALSVVALPVAFLVCEPVSPAAIFGLVLLGALFDPTGVAARQTLVPLYARAAQRPLRHVNSLRGVLENGADFGGPLLGAVLVAAFGATQALFVNALSFVACVAIFVGMAPRPRRAQRASTDDWYAGIRFVVARPALRALAVTGMVGNALLLPFLALLLPVLTSEVLGDPALLGVALASFGAGATMGAAAFAPLARRLSLSAVYYGGLLLAGASIALCGLAVTPWPVVAGAGLAGAALGAGNPLEQTLLQAVAPRAYAGQVFTALAAMRFAAAPVAIVAVGFVAERVGAAAALLGSGMLLAVVAVIGWRAAPLSNSQ
jgi:macrolide resistance protein